MMEKGFEPHLLKYLHAKAAKNGVCISTTLELTSRCNFNCKMCYIHNKDCNCNKPYELSSSQWIEIAEQAKTAGSMFLLLTGGEPFIREDFCQIYEAVSKMGFIVSLNTNLSLLTDEILDLLCLYCPNRVNVSLYGTDNDTYLRLCGVPAFDIVEANIKKLQKNGIPVKISSGISDYNADSLELIMDYCRKNELIFEGSAYMFPSTRAGVKGERMTPERAADIRARIDFGTLSREQFLLRTQRMLAGVDFQLNSLNCDDGSSYCGMKCRAGRSTSWIDWRGNMLYCGMIPSGGYTVLDLGFDVCWQKTMETVKNIKLPEKCMNCEYKHLCNICAASAFCETGATDLVPDYLCQMSSKIPYAFKRLCFKIKDR